MKKFQPMEKHNFRILYGVHPVWEALRAQSSRARELWLARDDRDARIREILKLAQDHGVRMVRMDPQEMRRRVSGNHQGVALRMDCPAPASLEDLLGEIGGKAPCVLVVLDHLQDPQNLGAILRSAACLGASGILIPERRSVRLSPGAVKASAGASERVPVLSVVNLGQALRDLKERGFWVYGADRAGQSLAGHEFAQPLVLVIGSEESGLRPSTRSLCDALVAIPQSETGVSSLNASAATAVILYEIFRQSGKKA